MLWLCFKLPYCLFGNTRDMSVMHEKAKFVCFIYTQPLKVKFKSVQINMKQVSYLYTANQDVREYSPWIPHAFYSCLKLLINRECVPENVLKRISHRNAWNSLVFH